MANRDLFYGDYQRQQGTPKQGSAFFSRLFLQGMVAVLLFAGVVCLYEEEGKLGEGVRYVVALARADQQEVLAVSSLAEVDWQGLVENVTGTTIGEGDKKPADDEVANNNEDNIEGNEGNNETNLGAASDYQPGTEYLQQNVKATDGEPVLVLPASGLMQSAFGDLQEDGLAVSGVEIFCQQEQSVKAAAIGEVVQIESGKTESGKIVLKHSGGMETAYSGNLTADVAVGDVVQQGAVIGHMQEGVLLFQVLQEGEPVDPLLYVLGPE